MLHEILFQKFGYMIFGIKKFQGKDVIVFEPFKSDISFYFTKTGIDYSKVVPSGDLDSGVNVIVDKLGSFNVGIQRIVQGDMKMFGADTCMVVQIAHISLDVAQRLSRIILKLLMIEKAEYIGKHLSQVSLTFKGDVLFIDCRLFFGIFKSRVQTCLGGVVAHIKAAAEYFRGKQIFYPFQWNFQQISSNIKWFSVEDYVDMFALKVDVLNFKAATDHPMCNKNVDYSSYKVRTTACLDEQLKFVLDESVDPLDNDQNYHFNLMFRKFSLASQSFLPAVIINTENGLDEAIDTVMDSFKKRMAFLFLSNLQMIDALWTMKFYTFLFKGPINVKVIKRMLESILFAFSWSLFKDSIVELKLVPFNDSKSHKYYRLDFGCSSDVKDVLKHIADAQLKCAKNNFGPAFIGCIFSDYLESNIILLKALLPGYKI